MKRQCYQVPEIRDENNNIIQEGTYGRTSPLVTIDNTGVLDYINNNLEALHDALLGDRVYVDSAKDLPTPGDVSVTYITGDSGEVYYYDPATATYIAINQGKEYAKQAEKSSAAAKTSEAIAQSSASSASTSASSAKTSETNAKTSETNASASETASRNWAVSETSPDGATDTDSSTGKTQSSRTWALESKANAQSASSSASIATTQASSASASASDASKAATAASGSATNAATSASNASTSAEKAKTSETNAANSESNALQYKDSALESKNASVTSEGNAAKSEINAKASMNAAAASATSASTSATNASVSEEHAATSETNAKQALAESQKIQKEVESALTKVTGFAKYAGSVDNYSDLPSSGTDIGDVWNIVNADTSHQIKAGDNVIWNGKDWDNLSGFVDLSNYPTNNDVAKAIVDTTYSGGTITFIHKDGSRSTATIGDTSHATQADKDGKGNVIADTYYKVTDAANIHQSFQNQINSKQDKLTFDKTPTNNSDNPVTSGCIKTALDTKPDKTGEGASGTWGINITGNASTATKATQDASGNVIADTYAKKTEVTVKGVKVDGSTSPLVPDSSGVITIPNADLSDYATKNYVQQLMNTLSTVSVTQDSLTKALSIK